MAANLSVPQAQPPTQSAPDYGATEKSLMQDWEKSQAGVEQAYKGAEPAVTKARQELIQSVQEPVPQAPKLQDIPQFQPRSGVQQDLNEFAGILSFFGAISSLRTRDPLASALNSAGAAMEGLHKGEFDRAKLDMEQFNKSMASAIAENQKTMDQYNAILKARNLSITQKQSMLSVAAAARDDQVAQATVQQHGVEGMIKLVDMMQRTSQQAEFRKDQLRQNFEFRRMQLEIQKENLRLRERMTGGAGGAGPGGLSQDGMDYLSAYVQLNGRMPIGMSRNNPAAWAVMNNLAEQAQAAGISPQEWAAAGPLTQQKLGAFGQLYKMRNAVGAFGEMLKLNAGILKDLAAKVDVTGSPYANKSILWLQQNAVNDPNVSEYLTQVQILLPEIARVLNNPNLTGQLTDTAREEMGLVVNGALPPAALNKVLDRVMTDADNRMSTLDKQLDQVRDEIKHPTASLSPSTGGGIKHISNDSEYNALQSGSLFIGPDGVQRKKP